MEDSMAPPSRAERRLGRRWVDPLAACLVAQVAAVVAYTVVPASEGVRQNSYEVIAVSALCLAIWGLRRHRPRHPAGWVMLLAGLAAWIIGELAYGAETTLLGWQGYPLPSDAVFWLGYLLVAAGLLYMVRTRLVGRDFTALLDAAIVAAGAAVVMAVFVIAPLASDTSLSVFGRVVSTSSPVNDILLLAVLVRLWAVPGKANRSCQLLMLSILCTLTSDVAYNVWLIQRIDAYPHILGTGWLLCYSLVAMAMANPGMVVLTEPVPARVGTIPQSRLVALAVALVLPGLALLSSGLLDRPLLWGVIGLGSFVLSAMVLVRMSGLLSQVQDQSEQLAVLARSDGLTGAPNRRTWDFELARAGQEADRGGPVFSVALMDLDHFKRFNDTQGHVAGDELLRNAVMAWSAELAAGQVLARYGGEEFAVLLPDCGLEDAMEIAERLRTAQPEGTCSLGVAQWDGREDVTALVARADRALYAAKDAGRDRVRADAPATVETATP
jgi:diguanylate cyclase (GGDEF)-like protein